MQYPKTLFWYEKNTLPLSDITPGWLHTKHLTWLTLAFFIPLGLLFSWLFQNPLAALLGLPFARLLALDLTTFTLPNVYTLPLAAVGLAHVITHGLWHHALAATIVLAIGYLFTHMYPKAGLGGGDIKLLTALFLFLPPSSASFAVALGCFLWLPIAFIKPKANHPFGIPLILGWLFFIAFLPTAFPLR